MNSPTSTFPRNSPPHFIVGYTGKATAAGYYLTVPMFLGTDGEGVLIKDIVPTTTDAAGIAAGDYTITVMGTDRKPLADYTYKPYKSAKGTVTLAGWYDNDGKLDETTKVTYGEGFMLYAQKQVTLTFAGQVVQTAPSLIAKTAGYYRAGNITPVQVNIKDLVPTADCEQDLQRICKSCSESRCCRCAENGRKKRPLGGHSMINFIGVPDMTFLNSEEVRC